MTVSISCKAVGKTYPSRSGAVAALTPVDLEVKAGEFLVIIGPSGCGKTTLLRMIGGLLSPSTGQLSLTPGEDGRTTTGFVFQQANLLPWLTVEENVALPLRLKNVKRDARRAVAEELCVRVGLGQFVKSLPRELSGGMQQRASIARALADDPSLLLMDEPFGALDALTRSRMNGELERLWLMSGATVVLVTHSISEAIILADRVVVMSARPGRIMSITEVNFPRPRRKDIENTLEFQQIAASSARAVGSMKMNSLRSSLPGLVAVVLFFLLWQGYCEISGVSPLILPPPSRIALVFVEVTFDRTTLYQCLRDTV